LISSKIHPIDEPFHNVFPFNITPFPSYIGWTIFCNAGSLLEKIAAPIRQETPLMKTVSRSPNQLASHPAGRLPKGGSSYAAMNAVYALIYSLS
jgi:hypothetical protein